MFIRIAKQYREHPPTTAFIHQDDYVALLPPWRRFCAKVRRFFTGRVV